MPFEENPVAYRDAAVVYRAGDIKSNGVKGTVIVHAFDDGLVPHDQSREFATRLRQVGEPFDYFTVTRRSTGEDQNESTSEGNIPGRPVDLGWAGHSWEGSDVDVVIKTGFDRLDALLQGAPGAAPTCAQREFTVDGQGAANLQLTPDQAC